MKNISSSAEDRSAADLVSNMLVWDNHACMPMRPDDMSFMPQLARCRAAGVDVLSLNIGFGEMDLAEHIRMTSALRAWITDHSEHYMLVENVDDIDVARAAGKLAIFFDIEGMNAVGTQPDMVRIYYALGVRWMLVAYNRNNLAGGGCQDDDRGLTPLGRAIVDEMAGCGMIACASHTGYRTARELIDYSANPVIFSHSNPRGFYDHPRNIPDDLMKACAERGGIIGINGLGAFLGGGDALPSKAVRAIDYAVNRIGPEHVALGLDHVYDTSELDQLIEEKPALFPASLGYFKGMPFPQLGPEDVEELVSGLLKLGYPSEAVANIMGGNLFALAKQVWK